jgi:hypothetical protein
MISIDVIVHSLGDTPDDRQRITLGDGNYEAISPAIFDRQAVFPVSFEEAATRLGELPSLYLEPDGSFVWVGSGQWQLDGQIADRAGRVSSVQVAGTCPAEEFERLLCVFGWPQTKAAFEVRRAGAIVAENEFRRFAGWM